MNEAPFLLHPPVPPWRVRREAGLEIVLLTDRGDLDGVWLRTLPDNEAQLVEMQPAGRDAALFRWAAFLPWDTGNAQTLYVFKVDCGGAGHWLAADGAHAFLPPEALHFRAHRHETPPPWVAEQVFYQIFPDRFARGLPAVDRSAETLYGSRPRPVVQPGWHEPVDPAHASNAFYGGDLVGIRERLPYLQDELGISALYLNPVFRAGSNHRYDTEDYTQVDPHLGGNAALAALCGALRERGMRLVLDAVVNHTGTNHPWFNRWGQHPTLGAAQSARSPYRSRYVFSAEGRPLGWKGHESLPVLDFACPDVQRAIYGAPDAVLRRWLRPPYAIDGWRLDVIHMLGEGAGAANNATHVRAIRRAVREQNPAAYVLGEHFAEATRWLQGDQEDGAMNYYGCAQPVLAWVGGVDPAGAAAPLATADFVRWLALAQGLIPYDNQLAQLNLLGSHDTTRVRTLLGGDAARVQLALTLLFTLPGVPCLYYGDEVGLEGGPDPDCRRPFDWRREHWHPALFETCRRLARLRRTRSEWQRGALQTLAVGDAHWVYARHDGAALTLVAVNRGPACRVDVPLGRLPLQPRAWQTALGTAPPIVGSNMTLSLPDRGAAVLLGG